MLRLLAELFSLARQRAFLTQMRMRTQEHAERQQKLQSAVLCATEMSLNPESKPGEPFRWWWATVDVFGVARFGSRLLGIGSYGRFDAGAMSTVYTIITSPDFDNTRTHITSRHIHYIKCTFDQ